MRPGPTIEKVDSTIPVAHPTQAEILRPNVALNDDDLTSYMLVDMWNCGLCRKYICLPKNANPH